MAAEGSAKFDVRVQGASRDVHPVLRDEVFRVALEALRNAFKHAEATAIEAEIVYGKNLTVRIRDDRKGMDPAIMNEGRFRHYGICGMRGEPGESAESWTCGLAPTRAPQSN